MCSILSKLGGTVPLRALYLVCHKEILNIVYHDMMGGGGGGGCTVGPPGSLTTSVLSLLGLNV